MPMGWALLPGRVIAGTTACDVRTRTKLCITRLEIENVFTAGSDEPHARL